MKTVINIIIKSGKRRPTEISGYHFGNNKPIFFNNGKEYTKEELTVAVISELKKAFKEAGYDII